MNKLLNINLEFNEPTMKSGPIIYFRGVSRIHVNRFKAYTHILSNRLKHRWQVTDILSHANVVGTYQDEGDESVMCLSLYDKPPNLNPPAINKINFKFEEHSMIKKLNRAGRELDLLKCNQAATNTDKQKVIKVSGLSKESTDTLCKQLNSLSGNQLYFKYLPNVLDDDSTIFINQLLFVIDPLDINSLQAFQQLEIKRQVDDLTIDELTVVVLHSDEVENIDSIFDDIYDQCNDNTQVTLLNPKTEIDLENFINFF